MGWWDTAKEWGGAIVDSYSSASSGSGASNSIWSSVLSGIGSYASDYLKSKDTKEQNAFTLEAQRQKGLEDRRSLSYAADLQDYYKQLDKSRSRTALDGYANLSLSKNALSSNPAIEVPKKPKPEEYHNG